LPLILDGDDPSTVDGATKREASLAGHDRATNGQDERLTASTLLIQVGGTLALARTPPSDRQQGASVDVGVPKSDGGFFDHRPKNQANDRSHTIDRLIARNAATYFGTAGEAYVSRLVAAAANDKQALIGRLEKRIGRFWNRVGAGSAEQSQRAQIFALAYAAGQFAIDYGVVPWRRSLVRRSIIHVYRAMYPCPLKTDPISAAAESVLNRLMSPEERIVDLTSRDRPINPKTAEKAAVLKVLHADGLPMFAIRPAYFEQLVGPTVSVQTVAQHLEQQGILIPRGRARRTRQVRIPGVTVRRGYYCLRLPSAPTPVEKLKQH